MSAGPRAVRDDGLLGAAQHRARLEGEGQHFTNGADLVLHLRKVVGHDS